MTSTGGPDLPGRQKIRPGTLRRAIPYAARYRGRMILLLVATSVHAAIVSSGPLILKFIIDDGLTPRRFKVVVMLALLLVALAVVDAVAIYGQTWLSAQVGQGVLYHLRVDMFAHVQRQPLAFFTRIQTGALVSRLNTDVVGAQQAVTTLLSQAISTVLTLFLVILTMVYLSWQITLVVLVMIPLFLLPTKAIGRRLQRVTRRRMNLDAELASMMNERFNVSGAMLAKLYGKAERDADAFAGRAAAQRDAASAGMVWGQMLTVVVTVLTAITVALVYGLGGKLVIDGRLEVGTLVALGTLLLRLFGPINQLSNMHVQVMSALVSFDRIFEVLDRRPFVEDRPGAPALGACRGPDAAAPQIEFDRVSFRFPSAEQVSLASLESIALPSPEQPADAWVLRDLTFRAPSGQLTALVGPSGAGKTTIIQLVSRMYDPVSGAVRIDGEDVSEVTQASLADTVGVVTQDAHMFHDTIRANLLYARPEASEQDLVEVCRAARIWEVIASLPDGLDTLVGERGYRLSGGEKQRIALARLLLKSPPVVVLDEATAHLDSESERAIQRVLDTELAGRTSLVIAHRLSTVRQADQILVVDAGRIAERGTHEQLMARGGLYADLYTIQFSGQEFADRELADRVAAYSPAGEGSTEAGPVTPSPPEPGGSRRTDADRAR